MLDLRRLDILQRFAVRGSIAAVATDLGYSPSAISQQLATLEREAGVALVERTAHSAALTGAGRELAARATDVLAAAELAEASMRARAGRIAGDVTVSAIPGLAVRLAPALADLQRRHSDLTVIAYETASGTAADAVLERTSDLAVVDDWSRDPIPVVTGLSVERLHREEVVLAVPREHPLAADAPRASLSRLRELVTEETWLNAPRGHISRTAGDLLLADLGVTPARRWAFDGLSVRAGLVGSGSGIALLPVGVVEEQPGVVGLHLRPRLYRYVHVVTRTSVGADPAIGCCLDAVRLALAPRRHR